MTHYEYLVGLEFYDEEDDARFRVTELSEEQLAITLNEAGGVEVARNYVLAHYHDLENGKEYYTTAKEVVVWVEETQAAEARAQEPAPAPASRSARAQRGGRRLRNTRPVNYAN